MKTIILAPLAVSALAIAACSSGGDDAAAQPPIEETASQDTQTDNFTDRGGYDDDASAAQAEATEKDGVLSVTMPDDVTSKMLGERDPEMIAVQVMLDKGRHSPGVIDGLGGRNTDRAIQYYRKSKGMKDGTKVDAELKKALFEEHGGDVFRSYTVTQKDASYDFVELPSDYPGMSEMDSLGYESAEEMLAERFHMDVDFLKALNPDADFAKAGTKLNIVSHGKREFGGDIAKIEVRKSDDMVVALDKSGKILVSYPATIGSSDFPSPSGSMKVSAVAPEPNYTFDPESQDWGPDKTFVLPAGPNNPVGGTWIDLGKNGYGIHGSPDPQLIGKTASHGCVRLTNWDAAELARAIKTGTPVVFV
ncbi:MAG: L,D-transpeptidase [Pontixanthobacter sp.]